jgi:hypothetical protein
MAISRRRKYTDEESVYFYKRCMINREPVEVVAGDNPFGRNYNSIRTKLWKVFGLGVKKLSKSDEVHYSYLLEESKTGSQREAIIEAEERVIIDKMNSEEDGFMKVISRSDAEYVCVDDEWIEREKYEENMSKAKNDAIDIAIRIKETREELKRLEMMYDIRLGVIRDIEQDMKYSEDGFKPTTNLRKLI